MITLSDTKVSILPTCASSSLVETLSAMTISNCAISSTISVTLLLLADGSDKLPVTVALWSFMRTVTRSPSATTAVVLIGVN